MTTTAALSCGLAAYKQFKAESDHRPTTGKPPKDGWWWLIPTKIRANKNHGTHDENASTIMGKEKEKVDKIAGLDGLEIM